MTTSDWDKDLSAVAGEIETLYKRRGHDHRAGMRDLVARKVSIVQAELNLERNFARIKRLCERDLLLLPRERALMHWGRIYLEGARQVHAAQGKQLVRDLWLKLVKTRLGGPGKSLGELDDEDLVSLAIRQTNLAKTEAYLEGSLSRLKVTQRELTQRYEQVGIADANREASSSLGVRLGISPQHALGSPQVKALEDYLRRLVAPLGGAAGQAFEQESRVAAKTSGLLAMCRNMVLGRLQNQATRPSTRAMDRFELAMQQLDDLEAETRRAYEAIIDKVKTPHPILIKDGPPPKAALAKGSILIAKTRSLVQPVAYPDAKSRQKV